MKRTIVREIRTDDLESGRSQSRSGARSLPLGPVSSAGGRLEARIETLAKYPDGAIQPGRDVGAGDAEQMCRLPGGESLVHAQVDHLAIRLRQMRDRLSNLDELLLLDQVLRARPRSFEFDQRKFTATPAQPIDVHGRVGHDGLHPATGHRAFEARLMDRLQDLDPADLKHVLGQTVVSGDPLVQRPETRGTAEDPLFRVALQEGTNTS